MTLKVIGVGLGRTGTLSLKRALGRLGLGPVHHMEDVFDDLGRQVPLWRAAAEGAPDFPAIYEGFAAAVDWPTASFWRELHAAYPGARFILSERDPDRWVESFSATIRKRLVAPETTPAELRPWLEMTTAVIARAGVTAEMDEAGLAAAFEAHCAAVKRALPPSQLLVWRAPQGWGPLCDFLGVPAPEEPFPRVNERSDF